LMDDWGPTAVARRAAHAAATGAAVPKWQRMLVDTVARALAEGAGTPTDGFVVTVGPVGHPTRGKLLEFPGCVNARPVLGIPSGCLLFDGFDLASPASRDGPAREGIMLHLRYRSTPWGEIVDPSIERPVVVRDSNGDSLWDQADFDAFPDAPEPVAVEPRPPRNDRLDGPPAPHGSLGALIDSWSTAPDEPAMNAIIDRLARLLETVGPVVWRKAVVTGVVDARGYGSFTMDGKRGIDEFGTVRSDTEVRRSYDLVPPDADLCRVWGLTWAGDVKVGPAREV
jgi:hypothetical protein